MQSQWYNNFFIPNMNNITSLYIFNKTMNVKDYDEDTVKFYHRLDYNHEYGFDTGLKISILVKMDPSTASGQIRERAISIIDIDGKRYERNTIDFVLQRLRLRNIPKLLWKYVTKYAGDKWFQEIEDMNIVFHLYETYKRKNKVLPS